LLVEDNNEASTIRKEMLQAREYGYPQASNGAQAQESLYDNHDNEIVLADYQMPSLNGAELIEKNKKSLGNDQGF